MLGLASFCHRSRGESLVSHPDRKVRLAIAPMLDWMAQLDPVQAQAPKDYPFVLAAGQRRMFNSTSSFAAASSGFFVCGSIGAPITLSVS